MLSLSIVCLTASAGCSDESGPDVGSEFPALSWRGFVVEDASERAADQSISSYSLADVEATGRPLALIHLAAVF